MITNRVALVAISPIVLALVACGSDGTPAVTATTLSGQVVKGPVGSSSVCISALTAGVKATTTLVPCVTSDATGNYAFATISYSGDAIIEATGGTYKDEATGATVTLSTPLKTIVNLQGGTTTGVVTPLTSIAVSATPSLSSTAFAQSAANIAAQSGLSSTNILTTLPTYGANGTTATNAYAAALGAIAQYQKTSGGTLAATLAAWTPANQAAFQTALNAYSAAASVLAANLPAVYNFAATGTPYSFAAATSSGVTAAGGLVGSSSFTLTGAAGAGFSALVGQSLSIPGSGIQTITFSSFGSVIQTLTVTIETSGTVVTFTESQVSNLINTKQWEFNCKGSACAGKVALNSAAKSVTLTGVTLAADTTSGATGTITANGSGTF